MGWDGTDKYVPWTTLPFHKLARVSINIFTGMECARLPNIRFMSYINITRGPHNEPAYPPYLYNDKASYVCQPGFKVQQPVVHWCHGRRGWTNGRSVCVRKLTLYSIEDAHTAFSEYILTSRVFSRRFMGSKRTHEFPVRTHKIGTSTLKLDNHKKF